MRTILILLILLLVPSQVMAARVCLERSTGKLIEYQSNATVGTLIRNALVSGYTEAQIEERELTSREWDQILEEQFYAPERIKQAQRRAELVQKEDEIRQTLGLSQVDFDKLKEVISRR